MTSEFRPPTETFKAPEVWVAEPTGIEFALHALGSYVERIRQFPGRLRELGEQILDSVGPEQ